MSKISNIIDFHLTFSNNEKVNDFLEKNNFFELLNKKEKYIWDLKTKCEYTIPEILIKEQLKLKKKILECNELTISAPTSFGKSYVISNILCDDPMLHLIISPTLSLCNEYFFKLKNKTKKKISMTPFVKADIYILTPEKSLYFIKNGIHKNGGIVVFDEFYEAFSGDRFPIFEKIYDYTKEKFEKIIQVVPTKETKFPEKFKTKNYFNSTFTPVIRRITRYIGENEKFRKYKYSSYDGSNTNGFEVDCDFKIGDENKIIDKALNAVQKANNKQTIILTSKKDMYKSLEYYSKSMEKSSGRILRKIKEYLNETNANNTLLCKYIDYGIAYHNGTTDKFVRLLIEEAFKQNEIKLLLSNQTITKGVNLSPDLLVIKNKLPIGPKSPKWLKKIDLINAIGRTGRTIKNKQIGNILIIMKKSKERDLIVNDIKDSRKEIKIEVKDFKKIDKCKSFEDAYIKYIIQKDKLDFEYKEDIIINYLLGDKSIKIMKLMIDIFNIGFNEKRKKYMCLLIKNYLQKTGIKIILKNNRNYAMKNKSWIDSRGEIYKDKKNNLEKFREEPYHEDYLYQKSYRDYENIAGFYFQQLLNFVIEESANDNNNIREKLKTFIKDKVKEEEEIFKMGWPDSFINVHNSNGKTLKSKKYLNSLMELIN